MASSDATLDSASARQRGNDLYRGGQFSQAEKAYEEAARLAPEDPAPWSNISAIKFEQGEYPAAVRILEKALALSSSEPDDGPKKQKLLTRMAKCHLHAMSFPNAKEAIKALGDDASGKTLRSNLEALEGLWSAVPGETVFWKQTLDRLPRYKGTVQDTPEYFAMGHDDAEPLTDEEMLSAIPPGSDLAFLLCGSGDARHLFMSLIDLPALPNVPGQASGKAFRRAHFTLVDINAAALARTLVMFDMIIRYGAMKVQKLPRIEDALTVMAYTYSSTVIPSFALEKMLESILTLIDILEDDADLPGSDLVGMLYLPRETRVQVLRKLKQWTRPLGATYTVSKLRAATSKMRKWTNETRQETFGKDPSDKSQHVSQCERDFEALGVLFGEQHFIQRREPELLPLIAAFRSGRPKAQEVLVEHIDSHWKVNPTMLDMDHELRRRGEEGSLTHEYAPVLEWNPVELVERIVAPLGMASKEESVLQGLGQIFDIVAISSIMMVDRLQIEVIAGEMADVLERIRHGCLEHRSHKPQNSKAIDPTLFPHEYDRIHMSNIPDYVGGPMTAHLYGRPLLREGRPSNLRFNNLLNPPMFESHADFLAEYMLMHESKEVVDHFGLVREKAPEGPPEAVRKAEFKRKVLGFGEFVSENYFVWTLSEAKRIPRVRQMSRPALEHWLHAHLLKICLPFQRPLYSDRPVYAPLNLTALFRLMARMYEVGYPAHWLSGVLAAICEGSITTTARAPRRLVVSSAGVGKSYPQRTLSVNPWKAEFTTLLSVWRRLLPFGVIAPDHTLVSLEEIVECRIVFPTVSHRDARAPHFTLVFYDSGSLGSRKPVFPSMLQDDEIGDGSEVARRFREKGVHVVMAFKYATKTRTATMWMRNDVVAEMMAGRWIVGICRTDTWELMHPTLNPVLEVLQPLGSWK